MNDKFEVVAIARNGQTFDWSIVQEVTQIRSVFVGPKGEVTKTYVRTGLKDLSGKTIFLEEVNE